MKSELAAKEIDAGKHCFASMVVRCCSDLGIAEPVINWAVEYDRSKTRYVAFVFFGFEMRRFLLDVVEVVSLCANTSLNETIKQKIVETLETVQDSPQ